MKPSDITTTIRASKTDTDIDVEFALPETLTLRDRCGAQALHAFAYKQQAVTLLFYCSHHARQIWNQGHRPFHHRDYRMNMTEWRNQNTVPLHLAQWDLEHYQ